MTYNLQISPVNSTMVGYTVTNSHVGTLITLEVIGCKVHTIGKSIRHIFEDPVPFIYCLCTWPLQRSYWRVRLVSACVYNLLNTCRFLVTNQNIDLKWGSTDHEVTHKRKNLKINVFLSIYASFEVSLCYAYWGVQHRLICDIIIVEIGLSDCNIFEGFYSEMAVLIMNCFTTT